MALCRNSVQRIPWRSSGKDSAFSLLRVQVQSLVRELRSHKPCSVAKKRHPLERSV